MSPIALSRAPFMPGRRWLLGLVVAIVVASVAFAAVTYDRWWPRVEGWIAAIRPGVDKPEAKDDHHGHDHGALNAIELTPQARRNIGLEIGKISLGPYERTISIPGIVAEQSGRTLRHVTAPLTGVVTQIHATRGETVAPGQKLFELRLTDEDVVASQASLLRTVEELDVIAKEIERLDAVTKEGGVPRKEMLDRKYEQQKLEGTLRAQKQTLVLHGLSQQHVDEIISTHVLLRQFTVAAPSGQGDEKAAEIAYQLQQLKVEQGQSINVGETLAVLVDPRLLLIEGEAFEKDSHAVSHAAEQGWKVTALVDGGRGQPEAIGGLSIQFVDSKVDPATRTLRFYVPLSNVMTRPSSSGDGPKYVDWRYKLGQRMQLLVPVETWSDRIVLPVDAVAQDGAEQFVFQENGKQFVRRAVHVEHRDERHVVIANDGSVFSGDSIALSAAQQLLIALKNKAAGPVDPHAGHNH